MKENGTFPSNNRRGVKKNGIDSCFSRFMDLKCVVKLTLQPMVLRGFAFALLTFSSDDHQLDLFGSDFIEAVSSASRSRVIEKSHP